MSFPSSVAAVLVALLTLSACSSGDDPDTAVTPGDGDLSDVPGALLTGDSAALSPDGSRIAVPCDGRLCVWSTADGSLEAQWDGGGVVAWSTAGLIATDGVADGTVSLVVLDSATGEQVSSTAAYAADDASEASGGGLLDLTFSADGETLAGVGADGIVRLWPLSDTAAVLEVDPEGEAPVAVAFEPDGNRIAIASSDAPVAVHDARTGEPIGSLGGGPQGDVAWSGDSSWIAGASYADDDDAATTVWDADSLEVEATLPRAGYRVAFTPGSSALVLSEKDELDLVVWSWSDDDEVTLAGATDVPRAVLAAPDGSGLYAVTPRDGVVEWGARGEVRTFDRPGG
jgi:WD40 repeat protein